MAKQSERRWFLDPLSDEPYIQDDGQAKWLEEDELKRLLTEFKIHPNKCPSRDDVVWLPDSPVGPVPTQRQACFFGGSPSRHALWSVPSELPWSPDLNTAPPKTIDVANLISLLELLSRDVDNIIWTWNDTITDCTALKDFLGLVELIRRYVYPTRVEDASDGVQPRRPLSIRHILTGFGPDEIPQVTTTLEQLFQVKGDITRYQRALQIPLPPASPSSDAGLSPVAQLQIREAESKSATASGRGGSNVPQPTSRPTAGCWTYRPWLVLPPGTGAGEPWTGTRKQFQEVFMANEKATPAIPQDTQPDILLYPFATNPGLITRTDSLQRAVWLELFDPKRNNLPRQVALDPSRTLIISGNPSALCSAAAVTDNTVLMHLTGENTGFRLAWRPDDPINLADDAQPHPVAFYPYLSRPIERGAFSPRIACVQRTFLPNQSRRVPLSPPSSPSSP